MNRAIISITGQPVMPAIRILSEALGRTEGWAITGSTNLAIRGVTVRPNDIDIITTRDNADLFAQLISHISLFDFSILKSPSIQSYYATAKVFGVPVDVMANVMILTHQHTWARLDTWSQDIKYAKTQLGPLPLTSLKFERYVHWLLGHSERLKQIDLYYKKGVGHRGRVY